MEKYHLKNKDSIRLSNVVFATTSHIDYNMSRLLLLSHMPDAEDCFVLAEGSHCSCYDFDETTWDCVKITAEELDKILTTVDSYDENRLELKKFLVGYTTYRD